MALGPESPSSKLTSSSAQEAIAQRSLAERQQALEDRPTRFAIVASGRDHAFERSTSGRTPHSSSRETAQGPFHLALRPLGRTHCGGDERPEGGSDREHRSRLRLAATAA